LKNTIYLKPNLLFESIQHSLDLKLIKFNQTHLYERLNHISAEYNQLNDKKMLYDVKAERRAKLTLWFGAIYLVIQFGILARMVWWEFNWDIMEPITYFVTFGTLFTGYLFFVFTGMEYTYNNLKLRLKQRRLRALYLRYGFNWKRWNELNNEVTMMKNILKIKDGETNPVY